MASTRDQLIQAGLTLADELPLSRMYAGVTTAAVAERAGVTTGSFFHHFNTAEEFADALARSYLEAHHDQTETVDEMVDALEHDDLVTILQENLTETWLLMSSDAMIGRHFRGQMHLFAHHREALVDPTPEMATVADVLRGTYRIRQEDASAGWEQLLDQTGLTLVEPFTHSRIATALTALLQGLQLRAAVDPDAVDDELFSDVSTLLAASILQPSGGRQRVADVAATLGADADLSPQARSGAKRRRESRQRITEAAAGMFTDGWESVTATEVADAADVSTQTVINLFRSVRAVAASTFATHVPAFRAAIDEHIDLDPLVAVDAALRQLALDAAADPEPARALLSERMAALLHHGYDLTDADIRMLVPLGIALPDALERLDLDGAESADLAGTLINAVLAHAIPRRGRADETVELAMRLLPAPARAGRRATVAAGSDAGGATSGSTS